MYVGTFDSLGWSTRVYRSSDGMSFLQINTDGFGSGNSLIPQSGLVVYKGTAPDTFLYAATQNDSGGQLWRTKYNDTVPDHWTKVFDFAKTDTSVRGIVWLHVNNDTLYFSTGQHTSRLYWSVNGTTWTENMAVGNGFGIPSNIFFASVENFNGYMFITTNNHITGGQLWKSADGVKWTQVTGNAFGKGAALQELHNLRVIDGSFLVSRAILVSGESGVGSSDG